MIEPRNFEDRTTFPGVEDNALDIVIHMTEKIELVPSSLFAAGLFLLAILGSKFNLTMTMVLFAFFLLDWFLMKGLKLSHLSYGPQKAQALELVVLRTCVALICPNTFLCILFQGIGTVLVFYGFYYEPHHIRVTRMSYPTSLLSRGNSIRILHLSDLHIERYSKREAHLQCMIDGIKPDMILFSGDILNLSYLEDEQAWKDARSVIEKWRAPLGVFGVFGSPAVDIRENMPELCRDLPIHWLDNEQVSIQIGKDTLELIGLNCSHKPFIDREILYSVLKNESHHLKILLYHSPDLAPVAAKCDIHLQLSGHTHGGQICLPFFGALITGSLYGRIFQSGLYTLNNLKLYISRGIGMEGGGAPRVRFLCSPEVIVWDFHSSEE